MTSWVAREIQQRNVGLRIPNPTCRLTRSRLKRVPPSLFTALAVIVVLAVLVGLGAADGIERRPIHIWSDGTRMAGDLWLPAGFGEGSDAPAILLTHGWGGTRDHLNSTYAPKFADAGFVVLTFDYRGWADSHSRLVIIGEQPEPRRQRRGDRPRTRYPGGRGSPRPDSRHHQRAGLPERRARH